MEHRRPSRTDKRINLPQSNQPTPPRRHRVGGGHGAPNKGEWDRRVGRLFEGRLAFRCQGYMCGIPTAEIRIRKPAGSLAFWEVVGEFLQLRRHLRKPSRDRDSHRDKSTAHETPRSRRARIVCGDPMLGKGEVVAERGDLSRIGSSLTEPRERVRDDFDRPLQCLEPPCHSQHAPPCPHGRGCSARYPL
jgi:hypothetical protein